MSIIIFSQKIKNLLHGSILTFICIKYIAANNRRKSIVFFLLFYTLLEIPPQQLKRRSVLFRYPVVSSFSQCTVKHLNSAIQQKLAASLFPHSHFSTLPFPLILGYVFVACLSLQVCAKSSLNPIFFFLYFYPLNYTYSKQHFNYGVFFPFCVEKTLSYMIWRAGMCLALY